MTNILIKSVVFLSLGAAGIPAFAQTQQPAQGQSTECPAGMDCTQGSRQKGQAPDAQGSTQGKQSADRPKTEQTGTQKTQSGAKDNGSTQQQGQSEEQPKSDGNRKGSGVNTSTEQGATTQTQGEEGNGTQGSNNQSTGQTKSQSTDQGQAASSSTKVTVEQKREITQVIREEKVKPVDVDFDVSVGVVVPKSKVELRPLPTRIIKLVPRYEGYLFFVLADGRIVIVEPSSLKVVVVLA